MAVTLRSCSRNPRHPRTSCHLLNRRSGKIASKKHPLRFSGILKAIWRSHFAALRLRLELRQLTSGTRYGPRHPRFRGSVGIRPSHGCQGTPDLGGSPWFFGRGSGCGSKPMGPHFGVGAPPILFYFSGDWDVHRTGF